MAADEFEEDDIDVEEILKRHAPVQAPRPQPAAPNLKERRARREVYATLILLALLLGSIYLFWILPSQLGSRPVNVDFGSKK